MLNYGAMSQWREERFHALRERLLAIALKKDTVVPPYEVANTLQGKYRDIPVTVGIHDFPYTYSHENPFQK
jgi:L-ribulose-5-phosphate 3-epimerase UlaE